MESADTVKYDDKFGKDNLGNTNHTSKTYFDDIDNITDVNDENKLDVSYKSDINIKNIQNQKSVSVCLIIPTYNESKNIPKLLKILYSEQYRRRYDAENIIMNVLVVDDNSPDGTANVVKAFQENNSHIYLLSDREKNGLGAAYIAGMQHAMKFINPDIIFEMDADLSHGPEYIMPMIQRVREGADFVIGSRYVKGGSIPENWGVKRKLISRGANLYAKTILGIRNVNDCTGGFRAIRTSVLKQLDLGSLKTKGYAFQISLLEEMRRHNVIMSEVPIHFKDRTNGTSKMRMKDILEEGLFVLRASFQNIFSSKRISNQMISYQTPNKNSLSVNVNTEPPFVFRQAQELGEDQREFAQAFGLEDPVRIEVASK